MKKRLVKKMRKEEIKIILSLHWQRLITDDETFNRIEKEMFDAAQMKKLSPNIQTLVKTKVRNTIEEIVQKNKESNGRYIHKRMKLFNIEELAEDLATNQENIENYANAKKGG